MLIIGYGTLSITLHDTSDQEARNNPITYRKLLELKKGDKKESKEDGQLKKLYAGEWANDLKVTFDVDFCLAWKWELFLPRRLVVPG